MDSLTQAVLGAAVGQAVLGRRLGWRAALLGAVGGTVPDLDVLWADADAVDYFAAHRGITHSVFFGPLLAVPLAALGRAWRPAVPWRLWWLFWALVLLTHPLLDLFTNYGTQLLAPFSREPFAIPAISIIDPTYTLTLLGGLVLAGCGRRWAVPAALALSSAYLGLCALQNDRALQWARAHTALPQVQATTTPLTPWLRRVMAWNDQELRVGFVSVLNPQPVRWHVLPRDPEAERLAVAARATEPGRVFARFATGPQYARLVALPEGRVELRIDDARFGMPGPHLSGLWGLALPVREGQLQAGEARRYRHPINAEPGGLAAMGQATLGRPQPLF